MDFILYISNKCRQGGEIQKSENFCGRHKSIGPKGCSGHGVLLLMYSAQHVLCPSV